MEGAAKSPIFQTCTEALQNRVTVRAYGAEKRFAAKLHAQSDLHLKIFMTVKMTERWTSAWLNLIAGTITTTLIVVAVVTRGTIDMALVGLALVYCLQLLGLTSWTMMTFVATESYGTSVERIFHLLSIGHEGNDKDAAKLKRSHTGGNTKAEMSAYFRGGGDQSWPSTGQITFENVKLKYRPELPYALNGMNLRVEGGEKIGVVGRTGAGKSSIMTVLLRLFEAEADGKVLIDGVVRSFFLDGNLHSRMPLVPTLLASSEQSSEQVCDQWHSSRVSTFLTCSHCKLRPNTEGHSGC
jgi:ABC-type multidrug transport system fused ATPase/permease subunit